MCGIGGIVYWDNREVSRDAVRALIAAQHHRGPDGDGVWTAPGVALTHNRLAIIDLETGQQPMVGPSGAVLTYNGELYNFRELRRELESAGAAFHTTSDTEVVLAAYERWGARCLERFRGMYAFAIWDPRAQTLFVARDRVGIKPLVYCQTPEFFAFSSELQGLLSLPGVSRAVDFGALDLYLHYQYIQAPYTIYRDVRKLQPAHSLSISASNPAAAPVDYWRLRFEADRSLDENEWLERLDAGIDDAVRCHLVSDVPFGAFLSGGVDSSIVAYHMSRRLREPVRTFTIGFDDASYDESERAATVARAIAADHVRELVHVDKYDLLDDLVLKLARHYGEPFADSSAIPTYCVSAVARSRVKMVLSGDGGDELFAGYNTYPAILGAMPSTPARRSWRSLFGQVPLNGDGLRARALGRPRREALEQYGVYYAYFRDDQRRDLYRAEIRAEVERHDHAGVYARTFDEAATADCLSALQYLDIKTYLPGDILTKVDVASMYSSLEVRVPLLDHHVIEMAARVPPELKLFDRTGAPQQKYLLKRYANRVLPGDAFAQPKHGFGVPIDRWFSGELFQAVRSRLTASTGVLHHLFSPVARAGLVESPDAARANAPRIWALLFLEAWAQVYSPSL